MASLARSDRMFDNACDIIANRPSEEGRSANTVLMRLRRNRKAKQSAADAAHHEYLESGFRGSFLEYIIANWDSIFAIIQKILALFGV